MDPTLYEYDPADEVADEPSMWREKVVAPATWNSPVRAKRMHVDENRTSPVSRKAQGDRASSAIIVLSVVVLILLVSSLGG
jgi:hypothetical protein